MTVAKSAIKKSNEEVVKEVKTRKPRVIGAGRDRILNRIVVAQADLDRYDAKQAKPSASAKRGLRAAFVYLPLTELHRHASRMYGLTVTDYETSAALIDVMVELHFSDANGEVVPPPILKTSTTDERDTLLSSPPAWKPEWSTEETDKVPA